MNKKATQSYFLNTLMKNLSISHGIYRIIIRELKDFFREFKDIQEKVQKGIETDDWNHFKSDDSKDYVAVKKEEIIFAYKQSKEITYENLKKFEDRSYLLYLYNEMEQYLYKCFKFIILKNPEILRRKTITFETLLDKKSNVDLIIEEKAEKIIHDIFYKDFEEVFDFCYKFLGIKYKIKKKDINILNEFKLLRNAYTHGDGTVSLLYLSKNPNSILELGDVLPVDKEIVQNYGIFIAKFLKELDTQMIKQVPKLIVVNK